MADDSKNDRVDPLFVVAGQIMSDCGIPDQIEVVTGDGKPVQVHLVYSSGEGDHGSVGGSDRNRKNFGLSGAKIDPEKGSRYVFRGDRPDDPVH